MQKIETMTSRERVLKSINREPIDRVPIDLGMSTSSGISAFAYWNLREYLNLSTDNIEVVSMGMLLAYVDEDIRKKFHCDCIALHPGWSSTSKWNPRGKYNFNIPSMAQPYLNNEGAWIVGDSNKYMKMSENNFFFDGSSPDMNNMSGDELFEITVKEAERIYKETDYYTTYPGFSGYFANNPDWLCRMLLETEEIIYENQAVLDRELKRAQKVIDRMGKYIQAVRISSDMGTQNGPWCNPLVFEKVSAPFYKKFCSFIHENSDLKVHLHCCGSIKPIIPILIDCGIDILNPIQISAKDMDPFELKKEFGDKIIFWGGGCDTQHVLGTGSTKDVIENVKYLMNAFKTGYGFIFTQVHNVMGNVPPENIIAMLDTAYEESFYSINASEVL